VHLRLAITSTVPTAAGFNVIFSWYGFGYSRRSSFREAVMKRLERRVAVITGGSSGIGRAAAIAFSREGAKVVIAARGLDRGLQVVEEIQSAGGEALFVRTDVSKASDVEGLIGKAVEAYGRIDCAFNNAAGLDGAFSLTADFGWRRWDV
jgi:NAD(P)-dependent dehydrogenase (short-subunit alcohol dehydrogenase family)